MSMTIQLLFSRRVALQLTTTIAAALTLAACEPAPLAPAEPDVARIAGKPDMNGVWEAIGTAYWNLEDHSAEGISQFWQLGAIAAIPAGQSVVEGGTIPYLPAALAKREENRAGWPKSDPEAKCYMPGIPRATYMPFPFRIVQGDGDILFVYEFASANRIVHMSDHQEPPVDSWMGWSNGHWDGDTLVVTTTQLNWPWFNQNGIPQSPEAKLVERFTPTADGSRLTYELTATDPVNFTEPVTRGKQWLYLPDQQVRKYECETASQ